MNIHAAKVFCSSHGLAGSAALHTIPYSLVNKKQKSCYTCSIVVTMHFIVPIRVMHNMTIFKLGTVLFHFYFNTQVSTIH